MDADGKMVGRFTVDDRPEQEYNLGSQKLELAEPKGKGIGKELRGKGNGKGKGQR
jgi:hypothetical protein